MTWFYALAERDHLIQNPTNTAKIRELGQHIRLGAESDVLDIACGQCGPAIILAESFGCRILGVEKAPEFAQVARDRIEAAGLEDRIAVVESDARDYAPPPGGFDTALCLGASFIWDGLAETLAALTPAVRSGGYVVIGEPFWLVWPPPHSMDDMGYVDLAGTIARFEAAGLAFVGLIPASKEDWDAYESFHWRALEEWLAANAHHPDADKIQQEHRSSRDAYLTLERDLLGWAIMIGWKAPGDDGQD